MEYLPLAFLAGLLAALAPCVLPLLPIILSGSAQGGSWKRPLVIIFSVAVSVFAFTLLLRTGITALGFTEEALTSFSGLLLVSYGLVTVFPQLWEWIELKTGINRAASANLQKSAQQKNRTLAEILIGVSLGPVFSSCSPTYAVIVAVILPESLAIGVLNLAFYILGFVISLGAVAILGQKLIKRTGWATNPYSNFKRSLGLIFILIGMLVLTGLDKDFVAWVLDSGVLDIATRVEMLFLR